jgi:hypothetical protein
MALGTKIDVVKQTRQGVVETHTIRYDDGYEITHPNDLITREFIDPHLALLEILPELIPAPADSLSAKALSLYNNTTTLYSGYLSQDATASFKSSSPAGSSVSFIVKDGTFDLQTPTPASAINYGDKGVLRLFVNGIEKDSFNLASNFDITLKSSDQVYTPKDSGLSKLTITSVGKYNNFSANQKVVALIHIQNTDLVKGYNFIELKHTDLPVVDQISNKYEVFFDTSTNTPSLSTATLSVGSNTNPKYLSGVKYLSTNDVINLSASGSYIFDNTYVASPVSFAGLVGGSNDSVAFNDSNLSGVTNPPTVGNPFNLGNKPIVLNVGNKCTKAPSIVLTPSDPFGVYPTKTTSTANILISTFANTSTDQQEYFDDETRRLPLSFNIRDKAASIINQWNSQTVLTNGNSQQFIIVDNDHGLMYPNTDFTVFEPSNTANYTAFSGDQKYLRAFVSTSSKSSIQITLVGVTSGIGMVGSGNINVQFILPSRTGLLDCIKPYASAIGVANDGDGALAGNVAYSGGNATFTVTFGGNVTNDSNMRGYILITLRNSSSSIKAITTNW